MPGCLQEVPTSAHKFLKERFHNLPYLVTGIAVYCDNEAVQAYLKLSDFNWEHSENLFLLSYDSMHLNLFIT